MQHRQHINAFSLIEIVLALGILSFALIAVLSLFSVGLNSSRQSSNETVIATILLRAMSEILGDTPPAKDETITRYFDRSGQPATNAVSGYYHCEIRVQSMDESDIPLVSTNLLRASLIFTAPSSVAVAKRPYTNTVYVTIPAVR